MFCFLGWFQGLGEELGLVAAMGPRVPGFQTGVMMAGNQVSPLSELVTVKPGPVGKATERTQSHFAWYFLFLERTSNMFGKWQKQ